MLPQQRLPFGLRPEEGVAVFGGPVDGVKGVMGWGEMDGSGGWIDRWVGG